MSLSRLLPPPLLAGVPRTDTSAAGDHDDDEAVRLEAAGLGWLTAPRPGAQIRLPHGITRLLDELARLLPPAAVAPVGGRLERLLGERAAIAGLGAGGHVSVGGRCRLLRCADGWLAVSLVRDDDVALLPAWLDLPPLRDHDDPWVMVASSLRQRATRQAVNAGAELGLAVAALGEVGGVCEVSEVGGRTEAVQTSMLPQGTVEDGASDFVLEARPTRDEVLVGRRVVDLSSLWAGPLCAHLLGLAGAEVVKVESLHRPDGARRGPRAFYDLLHAGHASVAVDFRSAEGRTALRDLIASADVVIEASRPRALRQLGIDAESLLGSSVGGPRVWVSITGYGRHEDVEHRVAFGDDAAVAGGLVGWAGDEPVFVGDAIADPLTGITAAAGAVQALSTGGRWMLDVALASVAAAFSHGAAHTLVDAGPRTQARIAIGRAAAIGADNARILS